MIGQLGFFPADAGFDAVELSRHVRAGLPEAAEFAAHGLPVLHSSDAHYLDDIGAVRTLLHCERPPSPNWPSRCAASDGRSIGDA